MEVDVGGPTESTGKYELRKVSVPPHRYTPLKQKWRDIFTPIVEHLELQVRFNLKTRNVEIRAREDVKDASYLQKAVDFVQAFVYGFAVEDALALVRLENLFIDTFQVEDVKPLKGDHLSRAIGRLAGKGGRTKFTIENATKTRIVLADSRIHILGSFENIQLAKRAVCNLILGTPPSKFRFQVICGINYVGTKRRDPAAPAKNIILDNEEKEETPQTEKTMDDLPPEVLTTILEHAILNEPRNHVLVYRLVNPQWKEIVESLLEKEVISRRLEAFPEMKIGGQSDQLSVYCPRTIFRPEGNPFSFNSLLLDGYKHFRQDPTDTQMALPIFISKFGSNLTTFALQDQIIHKIAGYDAQIHEQLEEYLLRRRRTNQEEHWTRGILEPPPLPSLSTLKLKSELYYEEEDTKINPLYVWLVASYADQLVHLCLNTSGPFPALQKGHTNTVLRGEECKPSRITRLEKIDWHLWKLSPGSLLGHRSDALVNREGIQNIPTTRVIAGNVKKLTVRFSDDEDETLIDRALLTMFPGLERIQLLFYYSFGLYWEMTRYECQHQGANQVVSKMNEGDPADEILALKRRLLPLLEQKAVLVMRYRDPAEIEVRDQIYEAITAARSERASIFNDWLLWVKMRTK
ncbi:RNA-binding protein PNO1 [Orchesella cincta]|uniref:RNA-binding protein PNO1 n=1 Tax=Orchesella cincta TaxID=48709 RepID=A0A1D2M280_ORCCI|nr:RNA-binding protein PNO1 [Orchesella cincta]